MSSAEKTETHMTIKDLCAELNVSVMKAHDLVTKGRIPAINIGTGQRAHWRIARSDYDAYLAAEREKTARRFGAAS